MNDTYNPFVQIAKAYEGFVHSDVYYKLRRQSTKSKILCAIIVTILVNLISFGIRTAKLVTNKNLADTLNEMPDFSYDDGILSLDQKYESATSDTYISIDTDVSYYYSGTGGDGYIDPVDVAPLISKLNQTGSSIQQAMFVSQSNFLMVNYLTGQVQQMKFSELSQIFNIRSFSKATIQSGYKGFIAKWGIILGLLYLPVRFALLFLVALIFTLLAQVGKSITKSNDDFNTIYWIAFYINIAFVIIKVLLTSLLPIGGSMLNTLFFALFIFIILKTLKAGDPDAKNAYDATMRTISYPGMTAAGTFSGGNDASSGSNDALSGSNDAFSGGNDAFSGSNDAFSGGNDAFSSGSNSSFGSDTPKQTVGTVIEDDFESFENNSPL